MHDEPGPRDAGLTLVVKNGPGGAVDGGANVGVGKNDVGALAAELQLNFLEVRGRRLTMRRPVAVDPVKAIFLMSGCSAMRAPAVWPYPGTTFTTPSGKPTRFINSAIFSVDRGVSSEGLMTIVLPPASAGAIFQLVNINGKFHGTIWPTTPTDSRLT